MKTFLLILLLLSPTGEVIETTVNDTVPIGFGDHVTKDEKQASIDKSMKLCDIMNERLTNTPYKNLEDPPKPVIYYHRIPLEWHKRLKEDHQLGMKCEIK